MQAITLIQQNEQQMRLIKQLAKTLEIEATVAKIVSKEAPKQKRKREILDSIERGLKEVQLHQEGKIELKSAKELLNEL